MIVSSLELVSSPHLTTSLFNGKTPALLQQRKTYEPLSPRLFKTPGSESVTLTLMSGENAQAHPDSQDGRRWNVSV